MGVAAKFYSSITSKLAIVPVYFVFGYFDCILHLLCTRIVYILRFHRSPRNSGAPVACDSLLTQPLSRLQLRLERALAGGCTAAARCEQGPDNRRPTWLGIPGASPSILRIDPRHILLENAQQVPSASGKTSVFLSPAFGVEPAALSIEKSLCGR